MIPSSLLALIEEAPASLEEIRRRAATILGGDGMPATELERGESLGLLVRDSQGRFALSDKGRAQLERWWSTPAREDELVAKMALAARKGTGFLALLDAQRADALRQIRSLSVRAEQLPFTRTAERLDVEKQIFDLDAQVRWLERIEALDDVSQEES